MSVLDTLRAATGTRKTVTMCLDGALQAEWDAALAALTDVDTRNDSMARESVTAAADHLDSLRDKVKASQVTFTFAAEGLSWPDYLNMQADHPPRDDNALDKFRGFNVETFYPALIRATCVSVSQADGEPEKVPADVWDTLLTSLNLKQFNNLVAAADYAMNGESAVPPSARSLLTSQDFGASLEQPSPGTSPPSGSEDGKRPTSPANAAPTPPAPTTSPT